VYFGTRQHVKHGSNVVMWVSKFVFLFEILPIFELREVEVAIFTLIAKFQIFQSYRSSAFMDQSSRNFQTCKKTSGYVYR